MSTRTTIIVHAIAAAAFFFVSQFYFLGETLAVSLVWGAAAAAGAAWLAILQSRRGQ
jgi:hypothetical protein